MISYDNFVNLCDIKRIHIHIYLVYPYGLHVTDFIRETCDQKRKENEARMIQNTLVACSNRKNQDQAKTNTESTQTKSSSKLIVPRSNTLRIGTKTPPFVRLCYVKKQGKLYSRQKMFRVFVCVKVLFVRDRIFEKKKE